MSNSTLAPPPLLSTMMDLYCEKWWKNFWRPYNKADAYIRFGVCLLGVVTNILNIVIFSRKKMLKNPTNLLLLSLAVADFLCVFRKAVDLSRTFYRKSQRDSTEPTNLYWQTIDDFINGLCFDVFHTWAIYLTLTIALSRYMGVLYPLKSRVWFTSRNSKWAILASILVSSALIPLMYVGVRIDLTNPQQMNKTNPHYSTFQTDTGQNMKFWVHSLLIKLIPCIILTMTTVGLVTSLLRAKKNRTKMMKSAPTTMRKRSQPDNSGENEAVENNSKNATTTTTPKPKSREEERQDAEFQRTTLMLVVMLSVFLFTEFPHGIFTFLMGIVRSPDLFRRQCYNPASSFFNLIEYVSSAVGFFIYLAMSRNFRGTFVQFFCCKTKKPNTTSSSVTSTTTNISNSGVTSSAGSKKLDETNC